MIDLSTFDFSEAVASYLVANTPLYLIRKLRMDSAVLRMRTAFSAADLLDTLRGRLAAPPATSIERVVPFALLVAISLKHDRRSLVEAASLDGGSYRWYNLVATNLVSTTASTSVHSVQAKSTLKLSSAGVRGVASSKFNVLKVR